SHAALNDRPAERIKTAHATGNTAARLGCPQQYSIGGHHLTRGVHREYASPLCGSLAFCISFPCVEAQIMHSHRRWYLVIAIFLAAASPQASAGTISDFLALTDQAGNILKQPGGEAASGTLTEEEETAAADNNMVAGIIIKVDIPNIYPQGVFPRAGVN